MNTGDGAPWWRDGGRGAGNGLTVVLLVATTLVLLVLLGVLVGWGLDGGGARAAPRPSSTAGPPHPSPSPSPTASPPPGAADAVAGDCVTNESTGADPYLVVTACRPGTYRVLKRFAGTADAGRCDTVAGTTDDYAQRDLATPSRSFVLCLQKQ